MRIHRSILATLAAMLALNACAASPGAQAPEGRPQVVAPNAVTPAPGAVAPAPGTATPAPQAAPAATATPSAAAPAGRPQVVAPVPPLDPYFDPQRLTYEPDFYAPQIQAFLETQPGPLKAASYGFGDRRESFADALVSQTSYYSINPKLFLALLELHAGLLSDPNASGDLAMGVRSERGLPAQTRWAVKQIVTAKREYPARAPLRFADGSTQDVDPAIGLGAYVISRVLAPTTSAAGLPALKDQLLAIYTRLFGDPRRAPQGWPAPAAPFLSWPLAKPAAVTSFFDHGGPFLTRNMAAGVTTYWGRTETNPAFAYNGHDGWDYAAASPDKALAAAAGTVVFAGNANDNCNTRAVVLDHANGYRTLYWHLESIAVEAGQQVKRGEPLGVVGESGCALGPHLHFGTQYLGRNIDPYGWCGGDTPDPWAQHPAGTVSSWLWQDRPSPCEPAPAGAALVDDGGPGFAADGDWERAPVGHGNGARFIRSIAAEDAPGALRPLAQPALAVYTPRQTLSGSYRVLAYIPYAVNGLNDSHRVRYRITHSGGVSEVSVDGMLYANDWADLGTYTFAPGETGVTLLNTAEDGSRGIWADAVIWLPER